MYGNLLAGLLALSLVSANPIENDVERRAATTTSAFCSIITSLVTKAKAQQPATSFCSSVLSIKTVTVTATSTSMIIVPTTTTVTTTTNLVTVTATASTTSTSTILALSSCSAPAKLKRAAASVSKPACFSAYSVSSIISSACKCLSIPTPTATVTSTTSATSTTIITVGIAATSTTTISTTITSVVTATASNFYIQASSGGVAGEFGVVQEGGGFNDGSVSFNSATPGTAFALDGSCHLLDETGDKVGYVANEDAGASAEPVYLNTQSSVSGGDFALVTCDVTATDQLDCSVNGGSESSLCGSTWYLGAAGSSGCGTFTIDAVPAI